MATFEFEAPHVFYPGSDPVEDATVLRAELLRSVAVNLEYLRRHPTPRIYESGVVYGRTRVWMCIPGILRQKFADCKSLAPWRIAEMIHYKEVKDPKPVFRWDFRPNGAGIKDFHVLIETGPDKYECPSRLLGMGKPGRSGVFAPAGAGFELSPFRSRTKVEFPYVYWTIIGR